MKLPMVVYSLVAVSDEFTNIMQGESKQIVKTIYKKAAKGIPIIFTTQKEPIHDESINFPGEGEVFHAYIPPYVTLLHYVAFDNKAVIPKYMRMIKKGLAPLSPISLKGISIGFRKSFKGDPYTCYVRFKSSDEFMHFRGKALELSKKNMDQQTYNHYLSIDYFPHSTILYDDTNPDAVTKAADMFDESLIRGKNFPVDRLVLEKTTLSADRIQTKEYAKIAFN